MRLLMSIALLVIGIVAVSGCQTQRYDVRTVVGGEPTQITVTKTYPGWTEIGANEISLATGVDPEGNWYIVTGDALKGLTQNPAVAAAIMQGIVQGVVEAAKFGAFAVP